jgi:hypothetical protein
MVQRYGADEFSTEAYLGFLDVYTELIERTLRLDRPSAPRAHMRTECHAV